MGYGRLSPPGHAGRCELGAADARGFLRGRDVRLDAARASPAAAGARVLVCHDGLVLGLAKVVAAPRVAGQDVGGLDLKNGLPRELIRPNAVV